MEPKFKVGDRVIICDDLETTIDKVVKDPDYEDLIIYEFKGQTGKRFGAWEEDVKLIEE